ncbi:MAG TPA: prolyl oligopeptidase family serine peptidase, partial [Pirellulaceae bacterium]|nr:prolyl oligopeptidase family serine peptidase [Pirellulaceae bacterium]
MICLPQGLPPSSRIAVRSTARTSNSGRAVAATLVACVSLVAMRTPLCAVELPGREVANQALASYFRAETFKLRDACLADVKSLEDWQTKRVEYRRQLFEMLGLDPLPERTELKATVTSKLEHDEFTVEQVHFQSRPGLYVTGNLYLPKTTGTSGDAARRAPAVLYVCGHGGVKKNGISYGNKTHYQYHGEWLARHGYVCLTIDTLQLGEIEGIHHGTYSHNRWWWLSRGYTSAGVEAWNCIRALDYLQSRPEVDGERLGVTGRSGGGAYSWWIAALDERIKVAVPVAGITDLEDHVADGCVEGHCDCMYMVNTYRWDYPLVAALVAPRALLISNTDRDSIFPLEGVVRVHQKVRRIYELYGAQEKLALNITAGPHKDTQELQMHAFRWFDQHLRGEVRVIEKAAVPFFPVEKLKVFAELPADQLNTRIDETFVPAAPPSPALPVDATDWAKQRDSLLATLRDKSFRGWPAESESLDVQLAFSADRDGVTLRAYDFTSQGPFRLRLYVAHRTGLDQPDLTVLNVLDQQSWRDFFAEYRVAFAEELLKPAAGSTQATMANETLPAPLPDEFAQTKKMFAARKWVMAYVCPRGVGPTAWNVSDKKMTQIRRRFYLLGQSLEGMQVYDAR